MNLKGLAFLTAFIASVVLANVLTTHYGFVPVGFGLMVTAGTYAAGLALVLRDGIQDTLGFSWVILAILVGSVISFAAGDASIAVASGTAFLLSELADSLVYTPLRNKRWRLAVISSSVVGAIIDTVLFLWIAFGLVAVTGEAVTGQLVGKVLWVAIPYALIGGWLRSRRTLEVAPA